MARVKAGSTGCPACSEDGRKFATCRRCRKRHSANGGTNVRRQEGSAMVDARGDIVAGIRRAVPSPEADPWEAIPRNYLRSSSVSQGELLALLKDRLHDYDAQVLECSAIDVTKTIASMLRARGVSRMVIPHGLPAAILPTTFDFVLDTNLTHAELNRCEGVFDTVCAGDRRNRHNRAPECARTRPPRGYAGSRLPSLPGGRSGRSCDRS